VPGRGTANFLLECIAAVIDDGPTDGDRLGVALERDFWIRGGRL